ncbi:MAG TPA: farnesyl diphosphate synthase [Pyrinomonadaceae bacterium]|nr:farnesyl diphosphate synthase [Pyrinomonadaceae bacterium]
MNDLETFFAASAKRVDETIGNIVDNAGISADRLIDAMRWSLFGGGKRFRPTLVFAAGKTFGASKEKLARTAAAVEMIHTYSLIHDDLPAMDDDDFRRGRLTCHKKFDEATAILAGDALQVLAFQAIADDGELAPEMRLLLISKLAAAAAKMVVGQQLDLDGEGTEITAAELELIHSNKTGALIRFSAEAGAVIGGAGDAEVSAMSGFGAKLGLLFQITDDVLDVVQTTESLGKTAGKDASASKATYPAIYGIEEASRSAKLVYAQAIEYLKLIDAPTGLLHQTADFILSRQS